MARLPVLHTHHHVFNIQQRSSHQSPFVRTTFNIQGITFMDTAMLDSGCSTCIIPISHLLEDVRERMTRSDTPVKGINGNIATLSEITCDVIIGDRNSPAFKDINILITSATTPILIGQNILSHNTVNSYTVNNHESTVEFRHTLTSGCQTQTAPLVPTRDHTDTPNHNPTYEVQTATSSVSQPTVIPLPYDQTLEEKLHWLKLNTGISLPNHPNRN